MNQVFAHYTEMEDYINGMYKIIPKDEDLINKSVLLLSDKEICLKAMNRVVNEWKISCAVNLSNNGRNQRSWLGQAACCIEYGTPETICRIVWGKLTSEEQKQANEIADQVIDNWIKSN
jgi:hypothetical protein